MAVVGGEGLALRGMGMTGAALLAGSAALYGGAGRVLVSLLDQDHATEIHTQPGTDAAPIWRHSNWKASGVVRLRRRAGGAHRVARGATTGSGAWCWTPMH